MYLHDEVSTDRRNPTVNAYGLLYGSPELSTERLPVLDPVHATNPASHSRRDPKQPGAGKGLETVTILGSEAIWKAARTVAQSDARSPGQALVHGESTNTG